MYFKRLLLLLFSLLLFACTEQKETPQKSDALSDDLSNKLKLASVPERVISLNPNLTEMIFKLGKGGSLVGNTSFCNYPPEAEKVTNVGDIMTVNYELVSSLKPDLIFISAEGSRKTEYDKLKDLGFNVFVSNPKNFKGIKKTFRDIGTLLGAENLADSLINNWSNRIAAVKEKAQKREVKSAMMMINLKPVMLAGKNTFLNELLKFNNLTNIAENSEVNYPQFSREEILIRDPDYIIFPPYEETSIEEFIKIYPEWKDLTAIKNGIVFFVDTDIYSRPGPRFIDAVEDLNERILKSLQN